MVATTWRALLRVKRSYRPFHRTTRLMQDGAASTMRGQHSTSEAMRPIITLTPAESSLFDFLLYIQHLYAPTTQLRVAGGWVRDKLRGAESEDIDIVLDNIYGKEFANHITKFQRHRKLPMSSVGVVKANSEKSKHLEVAQVKVDGLMVDFVHLRTEAYTDDSRVPDAQFAAPAEDALRRDITINALFYNLHTRQVEDFTGRGLDDLATGVVRTPLEPHQTFLDDPLRVLRAIRFACEFGFTLDPAIVDTVQNNPDIRDAMKRKVSRERVGIEVKKMLSGSNPSRAYELLAQFGLLEIVFHHAGDGTINPRADGAEALKARFTWTPELVARGEQYVQHVQHARLIMDKHKISFMEATAAILAPFFLAKGTVSSLQPALETFLASAASGDDVHWLQHVDERMLIDTSLKYRANTDRSLTTFPREDLIELLKHNVKWSKPAAKRVTHILEAVLAFPYQSLDATTVAENHLQLFLWSMKFHDALSPAIATLLTDLLPEDVRHQYVTAIDALATRFTQPPKIQDDQEAIRPIRRVDGRMIRDRLGGDVGPRIGIALEVLTVYEFVYPSATVEQELGFLDRLYPFLK